MSNLVDIGKRIDAVRKEIRENEKEHSRLYNKLNELNQAANMESTRCRDRCFELAPHATLPDGTAVYKKDGTS